MPCACMRAMATPIVCHETLSLQFLRSPNTKLGHGIFTTSGVVGGGKWHICALIRPPYTCAQCTRKRYFWCTHSARCASCLGSNYCSAKGGVTRDTDLWVHYPTDGEPSMPPNDAHGNGSNTALVVGTPTRPKKPCKVRTMADTSVPTTTCTTHSGGLKQPPTPKDGGYLFEGIQPRRGTQRMHGTVLKA